MSPGRRICAGQLCLDAGRGRIAGVLIAALRHLNEREAVAIGNRWPESAKTVTQEFGARVHCGLDLDAWEMRA
jgi:predicted dehydrogenase